MVLEKVDRTVQLMVQEKVVQRVHQSDLDLVEDLVPNWDKALLATLMVPMLDWVLDVVLDVELVFR
jgi:hypothetical protein